MLSLLTLSAACLLSLAAGLVLFGDGGARLIGAHIVATAFHS